MVTINMLETNHVFVKKNLVTRSDARGMYDVYKCERCGLEARSQWLGIVQIPNKQAKKKTCPNAPKITRVRVTQCNAFGPQFKNLTLGSEHDVIAPPEGQSDDRGCWVTGVGEPVLILFGEFEIVD